jgi:hypothetical protein
MIRNTQISVVNCKSWMKTHEPTPEFIHCRFIMNEQGLVELGFGGGAQGLVCLGCGGGAMVELVHDFGHETFLLHIVVARSLLKIALRVSECRCTSCSPGLVLC